MVKPAFVSHELIEQPEELRGGKHEKGRYCERNLQAGWNLEE